MLQSRLGLDPALLHAQTAMAPINSLQKATVSKELELIRYTVLKNQFYGSFFLEVGAAIWADMVVDPSQKKKKERKLWTIDK